MQSKRSRKSQRPVNPETAQEAYTRNLLQLQENINALQNELNLAKIKAANNNAHWGDVGDLAHYNELINQITNPEE